jgi:iron complex transport system permease protein
MTDAIDADLKPATLRLSWVLAGLGAVAATALVAVCTGPVSIAPHQVILEILDHLPLIDVDSGLSNTEAAIVWELRAPRVTLGLLVGAMLATSGGAYQGVFRNPLADPYLLGIAAGAGLGATVAFVMGAGDGSGGFDVLPLAAFTGALLAVGVTLMVSAGRGRFGSPATLLLAGVAIAAFLTAVQTYLLQRNLDTLRQVYSWILGRLATTGWDEVLLILPYAAISLGAMLAMAGYLDVLGVGDEEASSLGLDPRRIRLFVVIVASLAAAAAVSVSGLIGFVGLIVPHAVRMMAGSSNRIVLPLSVLFGAAFLVMADLLARTVQSPAELPIGVVTAFFGAPFFLMILRSRQEYLS